MLVFNDILAEGVGIGSDENEITILTPTGEIARAAHQQGRLRRGDPRPDRSRAAAAS